MWHKLTYKLGSPSDVSLDVSVAFISVFRDAGQPLEMAVLIDKETNSSATTIYFSPAASAFAKLYPAATPCDKPSPEMVRVYAGEQACWPVLFPQS